MNRYSAKTIVVIYIAAAILGLIGCSREEPQGNQTANTKVASNADSNSETAGMVAEKECGITDIEDRRDKVHKKIKSKVDAKDGKNGLKEQLAAENGFKFVTEVNDPSDPKSYLVVYVFGMIHGTDELEEFANLINDFNKEKGCVSRVVFLPKESLERKTFRTDRGFEWTYCPYDMQPCPDGSCADPGQCNRKTASSNAAFTPNANRPAESNSSANSNSSSSP